MKEFWTDGFYTILWIIVFILIFSLLINPHLFNKSWEKIKDKISKGLKKTTMLNDNYCQEKIIPESIIFQSSISRPNILNKYDENNIISPWKDGTSIKDSYPELSFGSLGLECTRGEQEGQNINYLYCTGFRYSKNILDEIGDILDKREYAIDLVVDGVQISEEQLDSGDSKSTYKIVSYKCNRI